MLTFLAGCLSFHEIPTSQVLELLIIPFKDGNAVEYRNSHIPGGKSMMILLIAHKLQPVKSELKIPVQQQYKREHASELFVHRPYCRLVGILYINFHYTQVCSLSFILITNDQFSIFKVPWNKLHPSTHMNTRQPLKFQQLEKQKLNKQNDAL